MNIPTESYDVIFQKYSDAQKWMKDIGVCVGSGRTQHYHKVVEHWKDKYKTVTDEEGKNIFPDFVSSMFEIHDFIDIYNAFHNVPAVRLKHITEKLQKAVNGPINANEETPNSTVARNFLFEAVVAAKAQRPTNGVEAILDAESDTGMKIDKKKLWVECKRVTTASKIEANVRKASSQLEKVINKQKGSGHRGIVALEVTKLINPGDKIYIADNDDRLVDSVNRMMEKFINDYSNVWQQLYKRRNKKIIGTIIRFAFMSTSESRNILVHASQWGMNPRIGISGNDKDIQKLLVENIKDML